jgi:hypothetical protein
MFGLIKLAAYCALGYMIYEFYLGVTQQSGGGGGSPARRWGEAMSESKGRMGVLTGSGGGHSVRSEGSQGESMPHTVGRGVM